MARKKRQKAEVEQTKAMILKAAARAFADKGYRAASMTAIAKEAGYTAPTLYTYFKGKAEIFGDLVSLVIGEVAAVYDEHEPAGLTFEQRLELLIHRQFKVIDGQSDAFAFFMTLKAQGEAGPSDARKRKRMQSDAASLQARLVEWLKRNLKDSDYSGLDPALAELFMSGVLQAFATRWAAGRREEPLTDQLPLVLAAVIGGLAGLASPAALGKVGEKRLA